MIFHVFREHQPQSRLPDPESFGLLNKFFQTGGSKNSGSKIFPQAVRSRRRAGKNETNLFTAEGSEGSPALDISPAVPEEGWRFHVNEPVPVLVVAQQLGHALQQLAEEQLGINQLQVYILFLICLKNLNSYMFIYFLNLS